MHGLIQSHKTVPLSIRFSICQSVYQGLIYLGLLSAFANIEYCTYAQETKHTFVKSKVLYLQIFLNTEFDSRKRVKNYANP